MSTHGPTFLDDEETWPPELRLLFDAELEALSGYESERERVDNLCRDDVVLRTYPPENPYSRDRERVLDAVNAMLAQASLVGWHCTRLHETEITSIERDGLRPLDSALLRRRIQACVQAGDLAAEVAKRLHSEHQADDDNRKGLLWFIFTRDTLRDEHGVYRLFRSWGGEALYNSHEDDPATSAALRGIGIPCLVEAFVPVAEIKTFGAIGQRFLNIYLDRRGISTGNCSQMEGHVRVMIPGSAVRRVIRRADVDFEQLTGCATWTPPL